ncbi:hypothetical protein ABL78_1982 [Leptomonas seymouri]|uniref:Protein phosphatase 1 regulatory subunit 7 n=1 Tax=Leptomonas seymouri TaxID=5684 RepID=A0A0N0P7Z8_LEPSE|nr:hypothetical protein ABL78_1982 [Leptomonas seymouri]|eukprot:KPI88937.1 hypothetical protein ABL78_1982 [Leptomonas seymouri]
MSSRTMSFTERGSGTRVPTPPPAPPSILSHVHIEQLRQQLSNALQKHPELRDLLGVCAESNDWTVEEARQRPDSIVTMELFLLQVHQVPLVHYFPNLVTIKFMNVGLESTADFAALTHVEELWLADNNIRVIEGLDNMTKLRRLFLQDNCITSLEGLPPLRHLREMWLSGNQLQRLTHLTPLRKLRTLYVARNPIEYLDGAFSKDMAHLHDINLSGCHIADIAQLCYLQQLPCLRNLWLADPLFGDNAICRMSNYTTLALTMLDSLDSLDGVYVTAEQRSLVESIVGRKRLYYEMRVQMLETHLVLLARHAERCAIRETAQSAGALAQLYACIQPVEMELLERQLYRGSGNSGKISSGSLFHNSADAQLPATTPTAAVESAQLESLRLQLARAVGTCEIQEQKTMLRLAQATTVASIEAQLLKERLAVELYTGGNVRLEPVSSSHEFFTSVDELMQSRFNRDLFEQQFSITSVKVKSVRRIVNCGLRHRFDHRVKELHADLANPQHRSRFVGLFGVVPTSQEGQGACLQHALLRGAAADDGVFASAPSAASWDRKGNYACYAPYTPTPADEGVPLTDSLFYADEARLRALSGGRDGCVGADGALSASGPNLSLCTSQVYSDPSGSGDALTCHGQLVLYRVYLDKAVSALGTAGSGAPREDGAGSRSGQYVQSFVQRAGRVPKGDYGAGITAAYRVLPSDVPGAVNADKPVDAALKPTPSYVWYCFDRSLVLADCVVDYCYTVTAFRSASSFIAAHSAAPALLDRTSAMSLLYTLCVPCSVGAPANSGNVGNTNKEKSAAVVADVGRDVREDLLSCAMPLLQFIQWCGEPPNEQCHRSSANTCNSQLYKHKVRPVETGHGGNTLKVIATKEASEAVSSAVAVLGEAVASQLLNSTRKNVVNSGAEDVSVCTVNCTEGTQRPLQAGDVERYAASMHVTAGSNGPLTLCVLRGLGLTAVWKDFACPLLASVTTLDLSQNSLTEFSWFAIAKEAPMLQKLNLRCNRLTSFHLDGSCLPALRTLDVSENLLANAEDFCSIRTAAPALEELEIRGNPLCAAQPRQESEARLLLYLAPPPSFNMSVSSTTALVKLNQHPIGAYPGTLAVQRYRRACIVGGSPRASPRTTRAVEYLAQRVKEASSGTGPAAAAALFSVDGVSVPERFVNAAVMQLEQWEAADTLDENLTEALRGQHTGSAASPAAPFGDDAAATAASQCLNECQDFCWNYGLLNTVAGLTSLLPNLCRVVLRGHSLTNIDPVLQLGRLECLDIAENRLTALPCLAGLRSLKGLVVDFNNLTSLPAQVGPLPALRMLSASGNQIAQVDVSCFLEGSSTEAPSGSAPTPPQLEALYISHNAIADMNVIYALRDITSLQILSVMGNPCTLPSTALLQRPEVDPKAAGEGTRQYLIHVFPQLKVLDGGSISAAEGARAREVYAGKINSDLLIEKSHSPPSAWAAVVNLNLSHCTLTEINLLEPFVGLEVLQLQHNLISFVSGLSTLTHLKALDLSHNRFGAAAWRSTDHASASSHSLPPSAQSTPYVALGDALAPLKLLESLSIEANQLTDLSVLKLRLPRLKFLNARNNDLQLLQRGLEHLPDLRELLLDQNKIRAFAADCLVANTKLVILSAESNAIKSMEGLRGCTRLEQLRLGANRLVELKSALADLQSCPLRSLVLVGNPVARKTNYRNFVISCFSHLVELDRRSITQEERERAATTRVAEYVAPPNVVIDMEFLAAASVTASSPPGLASLPMSAGVNGSGIPGVVAGIGSSGLPSRSRLSNQSAAILAGRRRGGGAGGSRGDRFNVNPRNRTYRR